MGLLQRSMYGFRTASANWMKDWQATLEEGGHKVCFANPALFHRSEDGSRGGVHGDDFAVVGSRRALDRIGKTLSGKYSMRESHRFGFGSHCESYAELLNRIVSVGTDSDGRRYVRIEPDIRHAELVLKNLGLEGSKAKPLTTPGFKVDVKELALREKEVPLDSQGATRYRSCVMRLSYLALDRADLGEPVKCLARSMAKPTPGSLRDLKKVARYLLGTKHMALHLWRQTFPKCISTYVDSDFAGCRLTRRSTTGMVQMIGGHAVKHTSNLQGGTGLNVSECEYYGLTHGAAHGLGLRSYMADHGFEMSLEILSDSSAARAFASRRVIQDAKDTCKHDIYGFRNEWQQDISQYKRSKPRTTLRTFLQRQQAKKHLERHKRIIGLRHVNAHSSQKELRLESIEHSHPMLACAFSSDQVQQFSCDKPAKSQMVRYQ